MRAVVFSMPDLVPHFFHPRFRVPSLAGPLLAANAPEHEVWSADLILQRKRVKAAIAEALEKHRPEVVGLSAKSFEFYSACRTAEVIRAIDPRIKIGLGGYHATVNCEAVAAEDAQGLFDFVVRGEGETCFAGYLDRLEAGRDLDDLPGLSFRRGDTWVHNARGAILDLATLRPPRRDRRVWPRFSYFGTGLDAMETTRGCTMPCNFCSITQMYGQSFRSFSNAYILASIEDAKRQGAKFILLADDNVVLHPRRFMEVLQAIIDAGHHDVNYLVQGSANGIAKHPELAPLMARAGFRFVFLGIESLSDKNLTRMGADRKAGESLKHTDRAIQLLRDAGILIIGGLIVGLPDDRAEDLEQNFRRYRERGLQIADQVITPYLRTGQREELVREGYVTEPADLRRYNGFWANVQTDHLSSWELEYWRWYFYRVYYSCRGLPAEWKRLSRAHFYFIQYVMRPYRWLKFKLQDPERAFARYQRSYARLNHLFGEPYDEIVTPFARGGRLEGRTA